MRGEKTRRFAVSERIGLSSEIDEIISEIDEFISEPVETTSDVGGTLSEDRC